MMSGFSTASSTPPLASPSSGGESGEYQPVEDNRGLTAGRQADVGVGDDLYSRDEQPEGAVNRDGNTRVAREYPELSRQTSFPDIARSRAGPTPIDLTRPMPSHSASYRKRRLASLGEHPRFPRTRSGEAPAREVNPQGVFPHRSVSMTVPPSRIGPSTTSGSSYATAIDITSSPPDQGHGSTLSRGKRGGHRHQPAEAAQYASWQTGSLPRESGDSADSSASSGRTQDQSIVANPDRSHLLTPSQDLSTGQWPETSVGQGGPGTSLAPSETALYQIRGRTNNQYVENIETETELPRWQPDSEVTECPICGTVFKLWYRKHHCRKCGRVVCASCSPHRITIPRQYIVRPPDSPSLSASPPVPVPRQVVDLTRDDTISSSPINPACGGGEEVRLCNPCVPDPNPHPLNYATVRPHGHRSTQSLYSTILPPSSAHRPSAMPPDDIRPPERGPLESYRRLSLRQGTRRFTGPPALHSSTRPPPAQSDSSRSPAVCERDLCPICSIRFPPLSDLAPAELREAHIVQCIENRVAPDRLDSSVPASSPASAVARMVTFTATEKDCLSGPSEVAECSICMEDYEVGQDLVRLECLCKFHKECIVDWFKRKPECPLHKLSS